MASPSDRQAVIERIQRILTELVAAGDRDICGSDKEMAEKVMAQMPITHSIANYLDDWTSMSFHELVRYAAHDVTDEILGRDPYGSRPSDYPEPGD